MKWLKKIFKKNVPRGTCRVKPLEFAIVNGVIVPKGLEKLELEWQKITLLLNNLK